MAEHDKVELRHVNDIEPGDNITSTVPGEWGVVKKIRRDVTVIWFESGDFIVVPLQENPMFLTVAVEGE